MSNSYLVARCDQSIYIKVQGLANLKNVAVLREFVDQQLAESVKAIFIDLSSCHGMDSTFMGTLVGASADVTGGGGVLAVVNPSAQNRRLLDMLGVSTVLPVIGDHAVPDLSFFTLASHADISTMERVSMVRRAHQDLIQLSEANRAKFAPFLDILQKDIAAQKEAG